MIRATKHKAKVKVKIITDVSFDQYVWADQLKADLGGLKKKGLNYFFLQMASLCSFPSKGMCLVNFPEIFFNKKVQKD